MQTSHYHIFSLPPELLDSLTPRNLVNRVPSKPTTPEPVVTETKSGPRACAICNGITFLDVNEQRAHFRSDWHRYNVKTRLNGGKTVSESAFAQLVEGEFCITFLGNLIHFYIQASKIHYPDQSHQTPIPTRIPML